jgi:hypothetical protein
MFKMKEPFMNDRIRLFKFCCDEICLNFGKSVPLSCI